MNRYKNLSNELFEKFPNIKQLYLNEKEWYDDYLESPHIIFGELLNPTIIRLLKTHSGEEELIRIFDFLEKLATDDDKLVREVVQVTVLEQIGDDKDVLQKSYKYMKKKTRYLSDLAEKSLGRKW